MNKLLCLSFLAGVAMMPGIAKAQTPASNSSLPAPVIAVVAQATLDQSQALKSILEQVEKKRAEIQKEMAKYEAELTAKDKKLAEEQKNLSEKEFAEKRQAFEKRVREIQEKVELRKAQMEFAVEDARKKVYEAFLKVVDNVANKAGANIVLYKETVITAKPESDLSAAALKELNETLPKVEVVFKSEAEIKKQLQQQPLPTTQEQATQR